MMDLLICLFASEDPDPAPDRVTPERSRADQGQGRTLEDLGQGQGNTPGKITFKHLWSFTVKLRKK